MLLAIRSGSTAFVSAIIEYCGSVRNAKCVFWAAGSISKLSTVDPGQRPVGLRRYSCLKATKMQIRGLCPRPGLSLPLACADRQQHDQAQTIQGTAATAAAADDHSSCSTRHDEAEVLRGIREPAMAGRDGTGECTRHGPRAPEWPRIFTKHQPVRERPGRQAVADGLRAGGRVPEVSKALRAWLQEAARW